MCSVVYLGKMLEVKVRIHLGSRDIGVPEQFLDAAEVMTGLEQMGGERMPEQMWEDFCIDALVLVPMGDTSLD